MWVFITVMLLFLFTPNSSLAYETYLYDNFDDGDSIGWSMDGNPQSWSVKDGMYGIVITGYGYKTNTYPNDFVWNSDNTNYIFELDLLGKQGTDKNVIFKYKDQNNFYEIHHTNGDIFMEKEINGFGGYRLAPVVHYPLDNNTLYHVKIIVSHKNYIVYIGNDLIFNVTEDSEPSFEGGKVALRAGTGGTAPTEVWFDNVIVKSIEPDPPSPPDPTPTPYPYLDVPHLTQMDELWGEEEYDTAKDWSTNTTISRWGCALTSASMILRYFNHDVFPGDLNQWLKNQVDGYLNGGLLNWLAISRFSSTNEDEIDPNEELPTLEYTRNPVSDGTLESELIASHPAILKLPGHFLVAKGKHYSDFLLNDPASLEDDVKLSDAQVTYGGDYTSISTYTPSNTDLSYILLTTIPAIDIKVLDPISNEITGYTFVEKPIYTPDKTDNTGITSQLFQYPKPIFGRYQLKISGYEGYYPLNVYLYDINGKVYPYFINGLLEHNQTDTYVININHKPSFSESSLIDSIIADLDAAYLRGDIYKKSVYRLLRQRLVIAQKQLSMSKTKPVKNLLTSFIKQLKIFDKEIDPDFAEYIEPKVKQLSDSL